MKRRNIYIKIVSLSMALALVFNGFSVRHVRAEEPAENVKPEIQEEEDVVREVIEIDTIDDFLKFADKCSLDSWSSNKIVHLNADIDLSGTVFGMVPVFTGVFDGQGHIISGFGHNGDGYVAGLFRYIGKDGIVENLKLEGEVAASDEKECIGGLCGVNYGTIRKCSFQGNVSGMSAVGAIAGINEGTGVVLNCSAKGRVAGYYSTGGIVGKNHGILSDCTNCACINNDSEWVEEDDGIGGGIFPVIRSGDSEIEIFSGVDTGGIAGYSDGMITRCTNYGKIGYEHTGYNIGGIAGRQSGVVSACTNMGPVYGRKDVGGIAGQMEPYIEVDEAQSLRNAVNRLHDLVEKTIDDMEMAKNGIKKDLDELTAYSDGAVDAGNALATQMTDFVNDNLDQAQAVTNRLEHVMDMLPEVFDDILTAEDYFSKANEAFKKIADDLKALGDLVPESVINEQQTAIERVNGSSREVDKILQQIMGSPIVTQEQLTELAKALDEMSDAASAAMGTLSAVEGSVGQQALDKIEDMGNHLTLAMDYLQKAMTYVKSATRGAKSIVDYVNGQSHIQFSKLGGDFDANRESLHGQLKGMSNSIRSLGNDASGYSDVVNDDLRAVNDQINVVFNLLADSMTNRGGISVEELYEDADIEDMDSITTGKVSNCTNKGIIEGDINIGGIAGAMSIDEEDPEGSAAGSVEYEIGGRYFTKCIITGSVNEGYVTAKKNGAGGIAGYMRHGIVVSSEGYGSVESTEGDYAGGICGESLTVIRDCYALCSVSGGRNVGGIAGFANTLQDCYALVDCNAATGRKGAIAGQTADYVVTPDEDAKVSGNYYVGDGLYGIDNISYAGIAEPMSYDELLTNANLPIQFRQLKVIFRMDDLYLGSQEVGFGESLSGLEYPQIPEKEGYYGVWPDYSDKIMAGNLVIRGEYKEVVTVVQSGEMQIPEAEGGHEKPYALVEHSFTEDTTLNVGISGMTPPEEALKRENVIYDVTLENAGVEDTECFAIRLYNPYRNADVWGYKDGIWSKLESKSRGQYLQVEMAGYKQSFCVAEHKSGIWIIIVCVGGGLAALVLVLRKIIKMR